MGLGIGIVGLPNVGKSTLFNRMCSGRRAIVDVQSGVTRDRHYGKCEWGGQVFSVIDTGGYVKGSEDVFEEAIRKQVVIAIEEANVIVFMVDVASGITTNDETVANLLRKNNKQVLLVVNKVDNHELSADASLFYKFGIGEPYEISAAGGSGTGDLMDAIMNLLPEESALGGKEEEELPRFAIVGRPNVGKSSLANVLLGKERNIVTDIAGTTRDAINTRYNAYGHDFMLIDTAGLRKKTKVDEDIEFYAVIRSIRAIENCDVCLLLIEAHEGLLAQDMNILHLIIKNKRGLVILVNKWDLVEKETNTIKNFEEQIKEKLQPFNDVPIIFTSVKDKQRIFKALEVAEEVYKRRTQKIPTSKLNDVMLKIIERYPPPANKGKHIKIKYVTQLPTHAPSFAFFCNHPKYIKEPYQRYIENRMREEFDFRGVPIQLYFREK